MPASGINPYSSFHTCDSTLTRLRHFHIPTDWTLAQLIWVGVHTESTLSWLISWEQYLSKNWRMTRETSTALESDQCTCVPNSAPAIHANAMRSWFGAGASPTGGGVGGPDPRTFENRVGGPPRFKNEVTKIRCFFRFLGYFGVGWPPCRRFDPPLKNPWRRPWFCATHRQ